MDQMLPLRQWQKAIFFFWRWCVRVWIAGFQTTNAKRKITNERIVKRNYAKNQGNIDTKCKAGNDRTKVSERIKKKKHTHPNTKWNCWKKKHTIHETENCYLSFRDLNIIRITKCGRFQLVLCSFIVSQIFIFFFFSFLLFSTFSLIIRSNGGRLPFSQLLFIFGFVLFFYFIFIWLFNEAQCNRQHRYIGQCDFIFLFCWKRLKDGDIFVALHFLACRFIFHRLAIITCCFHSLFWK